jgi:hypothetical protein
MSRAEEVCWVEAQWDRDTASDGVSRYGAYLRDKAKRFEPWYGEGVGVTVDPVEFAVGAFAVATAPIMSPGYVVWHPRVQAHEVTRNDQDGRLQVSVTLATSSPVRLRSPWWGWQQELGRYIDPPDRQHAALTRLELRWPIPTERLHQPHPPSVHGIPNLDDAKATVRVPVGEINATAGPVLAELEGGASRGRGRW